MSSKRSITKIIPAIRSFAKQTTLKKRNRKQMPEGATN